MYWCTVKPMNKDIPETMKLTSYNGGSLYSELISNDCDSAWLLGIRSLVGSWLLIGGLLFRGFTVLKNSLSPNDASFSI